MLKLIVGVKGTGKTKVLIEMANNAVEETKGSVICIEKGTKLIHEINYRARLVDTEEYFINDARSLYGLVAGMYASNRDITHIFIDSALKICNNDIDLLVDLIEKLNTFGEKNHIEFIVTSSLPVEDVPEVLKKYV